MTINPITPNDLTKKVENSFISGSGAPTYNTVAEEIGTVYYDEDSKQMYTCVGISNGINGILGNITPVSNLLYFETQQQYINTEYVLSSLATNYRIVFKLYQNVTWSRNNNNSILKAKADGTGNNLIYVDTGGWLHFYNNAELGTSSTTLPVNTWIWLEVKWDGTNLIASYIADDDYTYVTLPATGWTTLKSITTNLFGRDEAIVLGHFNSGQYWTNGKVDQNSFAIYVNDELAYALSDNTTKIYAWLPAINIINGSNNSLIVDPYSQEGIDPSTFSNATRFGNKTKAHTDSTVVGYSARANIDKSVAIGSTAVANKTRSIALGYNAMSEGRGTTQIGKGRTTSSQQFNVSLNYTATIGDTEVDDNYKLLNYLGQIPSDRLIQSAISGSGIPTDTTAASFIGQIYTDTVANKAYRCFGIGNTGTAHFTTIGTPTFTDHNVSGFLDSNYLTIPNYLNPANYRNFEIQVAFTLGELNHPYQGLIESLTSGQSGISLDITSANKLHFAIWNNGWKVNVDTNVLSVNTKYVAKIKYDPLEGYCLLLKSGSNTYYTYWTNATVTKPYFDSNVDWILGRHPSASTSGSGYYFCGTIHLDECYIKLDDRKVWEPYSNYQWRELIENTATGSNSLTVGGTATTNNLCLNIGIGSNVTANGATSIGANAKSGSYCVSIGNGAKTTASNSVAIGAGAQASGSRSVCIGVDAYSLAKGAIALGNEARNSEENTFKVSVNGNATLTDPAIDEASGLYTLLDSSGNIPAARLGALPVNDGEYTLKLTIADGVPTLTWVSTT